MNEAKLKDELTKNNVKDNLSGKIDKLTFDYFKGEKVYDIKPNIDGAYGYMCVSIAEKSGIDICLGGVKIFDGLESVGTIIPLRFMSGDQISISGECKHLKILLSGADFEYLEDTYLLYRTKRYVEDCGGVHKIYSYDKLNLGKSSFSLEEVDDSLSVVEYEYGNDKYLAKIKKNDGGYICTSMDNYTQKILLNFDYENLIVVGGRGENMLDIIYSKVGVVYARGVDGDGALLEPEIISSNLEGVVDLRQICSDGSTKAFEVVFASGISVVYIFSKGVYSQFFTTKRRKSNFCIVGNYIYHICKMGYDILIRKYLIDKNNARVNYVLAKNIVMADSAITDGSTIVAKNNLIERIYTI